jgi:hypothetical protein
MVMINELERLSQSVPLQLLLSHYAEAGVTTPGEWQERARQLERVEVRLLAKLHGELLAYEWIEQNTHQTIHGRASATRCCYRVTEAGMLALKQVLTGLAEADDVLSGIATRSEVRRTMRNEKARARRKRKQVRER